MGVLYWMERQDTGELFEMDKAYRHFPPVGFASLMRLFGRTPITKLGATPERLRQVLYGDKPWYEGWDAEAWREHGAWVVARLCAWAGDARVRFVSEFELERRMESYEESEARVTGSIFRDDYEPDGVTFKSRAQREPPD